ncbi:hypothetical protein MX652_09680 [Thauera aromatica]|nr:hypothetical protein [Thauera aromatica]MCK2126960.1 hypothetical protein [Thauera aromatica]
MFDQLLQRSLDLLGMDFAADASVDGRRAGLYHPPRTDCTFAGRRRLLSSDKSE